MNDSAEDSPPPTGALEIHCACGRDLHYPRAMEGEPLECPWCGRVRTPEGTDQAICRRCEKQFTPESASPAGRVCSDCQVRGRGVWKFWVSLLLVGAAIASFDLAIRFRWFERDQGVLLRYRVLFPDDFSGNREKAAEDCMVALLSRAGEVGRFGSGTLEAVDTILLRIHLGKKEDLARLRRLFSRQGALGLYKSAPRDVQSKYNVDQEIPAGFRAWDNREAALRQMRALGIIYRTHGHRLGWSIGQEG